LILVDANLLLHATNSSSPQHEAARRWLEATFSKPEPVGIAWTTVLAFVRIGTNPRAFEHPLSIAEAVTIVSDWLDHPSLVIPGPEERHWEVLRDLLIEGQCHGPLVMDAELAALAIEHGATLATNDKDFARFPRLRFFNPLIAS
jgi:uncharacterized protein